MKTKIRICAASALMNLRRKSDQNSVLSRNHTSSSCRDLHAIARKSVHSKFSAKNMCEVSWSAQSSVRPEMMKLRTTLDVGSCFPGFLIKHRKPGRNSVLSKNISACTSVHLRAPACTDVHRFTVPEKRVRRYRVRTDLCSAMKMNAQSANAIEERASRAPLTRETCDPYPASPFVNPSPEVVLTTYLPPPFTGTLLLANLASEFISQPGHTGMMDPASMCHGKDVAPSASASGRARCHIAPPPSTLVAGVPPAATAGFQPATAVRVLRSALSTACHLYRIFTGPLPACRARGSSLNPNHNLNPLSAPSRLCIDPGAKPQTNPSKTQPFPHQNDGGSSSNPQNPTFYPPFIHQKQGGSSSDADLNPSSTPLPHVRGSDSARWKHKIRPKPCHFPATFRTIIIPAYDRDFTETLPFLYRFL
jgi:hypothetical protein